MFDEFTSPSTDHFTPEYLQAREEYLRRLHALRAWHQRFPFRITGPRYSVLLTSHAEASRHIPYATPAGLVKFFEGKKRVYHGWRVVYPPTPLTPQVQIEVPHELRWWER